MKTTSLLLSIVTLTSSSYISHVYSLFLSTYIVLHLLIFLDSKIFIELHNTTPERRGSPIGYISCLHAFKAITQGGVQFLL